MTDIIHEHREEAPTPPSPAAAAEPPMDEQTGQKRVYGYIFLLFMVAFCLLLWSFLMNQRSTDEVLNELRGSNSSLQSTLDRNISLEQRVDELEVRNAELARELQELREESGKWKNAAETNLAVSRSASLGLIAMDYLRGLEKAVEQKDVSEATACIERLEEAAQPYGEDAVDTPLKAFLPESTTRKNADGSDAETPAETFERLRAEFDGFGFGA